MSVPSLNDWLASRPKAALAKGPIGIILVEDRLEVASTVAHHLKLGFARLLVLSAEPLTLDLDEVAATRVTNLLWNTRQPDAHVGAVNAVIAAVPPATWLYYGWNGEYLFYPFCETRRLPEMLAFHAEERRDAMLTFVVDLYPCDPAGFPADLRRDDARFDRLGYYALARLDADKHPRERQLDFYGGLRWRFEDLLPQNRLRIDRVGLFRAAKGLALLPDHRFNVEEYNTYSCPWHNNITAAIASFRVAKALALNPRSRGLTGNFAWLGSEPFRWSSRQLMDAGLMEPGQWF